MRPAKSTRQVGIAYPSSSLSMKRLPFFLSAVFAALALASCQKPAEPAAGRIQNSRRRSEDRGDSEGHDARVLEVRRSRRAESWRGIRREDSVERAAQGKRPRAADRHRGAIRLRRRQWHRPRAARRHGAAPPGAGRECERHPRGHHRLRAQGRSGQGFRQLRRHEQPARRPDGGRGTGEAARRQRARSCSCATWKAPRAPPNARRDSSK